MNTPAQMITDKLKSLLRFGAQSTRYKDIFDIYYLFDKADTNILNSCVEKYIYQDSTLDVNNIKDILNRIDAIFNNHIFIERVEKSEKNWLGIDIDVIYKGFLDYFMKELYN